MYSVNTKDNFWGRSSGGGEKCVLWGRNIDTCRRWLGLRTLVQGRDNAVGIAIRYGLVGPGIEFPSTPALGHIQPPMQRVPRDFRGWSGRGVSLNTHPHLAPRLKKEQSYTYSPPLYIHGCL